MSPEYTDQQIDNYYAGDYFDDYYEDGLDEWEIEEIKEEMRRQYEADLRE